MQSSWTSASPAGWHQRPPASWTSANRPLAPADHQRLESLAPATHQRFFRLVNEVLVERNESAHFITSLDVEVEVDSDVDVEVDRDVAVEALRKKPRKNQIQHPSLAAFACEREWSIHNRRKAMKTKPIEYRVDPVTGCHIVTNRHIPKNGYPQIQRAGKTQLLHAWLFEQQHGPLPKGMVARHVGCHNRACVNLDHIVPGTQADNVRDTVKAGRHNPPRGERSATHKLKTDQILEIRRSPWSQDALASHFGVTQGQISRIVTRKGWRHVA